MRDEIIEIGKKIYSTVRTLPVKPILVSYCVADEKVDISVSAEDFFTICDGRFSVNEYESGTEVFTVIGNVKISAITTHARLKEFFTE